MFEEQYKKYCTEMTPSPALDQDTVALMQEAQNHRAAPLEEPARFKPRLVLPIVGTAAAAVIAFIIVGAWLLKGDGQHFDDVMSDDFEFDSFNSEESDTETNADSALKEDSPTTEAPPLENKEENKSEPEESKPSEEKSEEIPPSSGSSEQEENKSKPEENGAPDGETNETPEEEGTVTPIDPFGPETSHEKDFETYLSIQEFIDALAKKETGGYGKNYYNARELLIVPNLLPDGARFRHLHLNTKNGSYNYSYYFKKDGRDFILDIEINAKPPKNPNELRLYKVSLATEEVLSAKKDDQLYFLFGKRDEVTVTLTDAMASTRLTEEETAELLSQFKLERCSLNNPVVNMKY